MQNVEHQVHYKKYVISSSFLAVIIIRTLVSETSLTMNPTSRRSTTRWYCFGCVLITIIYFTTIGFYVMVHTSDASDLTWQKLDSISNVLSLNRTATNGTKPLGSDNAIPLKDLPERFWKVVYPNIQHPAVRTFVMQRHHVHNERRQLMQSTCKEWIDSGLYMQHHRSPPLMVNLKYKIAGCLNKLSEPHVIWSLLEPMPYDSPKEIIHDLLETSLRFTYVRHPFVRLAEAFNEYVLQRRWYRQPIERHKIPGLRTVEDVPVFAEFVDAVLAEKLHRRLHLRPFANRCDYCHNRYDFIGHYEDGDTDMMYIALRAGAEDWITFLTDQPVNTTKEFANKSNAMDLLALEYFSSLDRATILSLYDIYRIDFELFGYDHKKFLDRGKGAEDVSVNIQ